MFQSHHSPDLPAPHPPAVAPALDGWAPNRTDGTDGTASPDTTAAEGGQVAEDVVEQIGLIVNRAPNGVLNEGTKEEIEIQGLNLLGVVPQDELVYEYDCEGRPTVELPEDSPVRKAMSEIVKKLNL